LESFLVDKRFEISNLELAKDLNIVFEEWKRIFYSGASKEEIMPIQTLLSDWVDELEKEG